MPHMRREETVIPRARVPAARPASAPVEVTSAALKLAKSTT